MRNFFEQFECLSQAHCDFCRLLTDEGRQWRESIAKHFSVPFDNAQGKPEIDFECPHGKPWLKEKPDGPLLSKILKAGSKAIGRTFGGDHISDADLAARVEICRACDMIRIDDIGEWCGELIRLRLGKESKKNKGCGCLLNEKRLYIKFKCPRDKWPQIEAPDKEKSNG